MGKIKFIYFDIGGVMIRDFSNTNKWNELTTSWKIFGERKKDIDGFSYGIEKEVSEGRDIDDFLPILKSVFEVKVPEKYSILKDFVDRFEKNEKIWKIVEECKKKYRVGLLTNMYPRMFDSINKRNLMPKNCWEIIIDSAVEKCSKPDEKIYKIAQERAKVKPEEILFVDNLKKNLEAATKLGWQTFWFDNKDYEKANRELEKFLNLPPSPLL